MERGRKSHSDLASKTVEGKYLQIPEKWWKNTLGLAGNVYKHMSFSEAMLNTRVMLFSHCLDIEAEDWSRNFPCLCIQFYLLAKSLFASMSFCCQLLLKNISDSTAFHLLLSGDFLFTGCEWEQVARAGRFFCRCSHFAFSCTCTGSAVCQWNHDVQKGSGRAYKAPGKI